jgi:hypothetical protein
MERRVSSAILLTVSDVRGTVAAYVADQYLLGAGEKGWRLARRAVRRREIRKYGEFDSWPVGQRYLKRLHRFLKRKGYIPSR